MEGFGDDFWTIFSQVRQKCDFVKNSVSSKNRSKIDSGKVLASIWEGLGTGWSLSWALSGTSWAFLGLQNQALLKDSSQMGAIGRLLALLRRLLNAS